MALLTAMSENRQLKDLPQAEFGRVPEKFLVYCVLKKITPIVCFCSVLKHFFILSLSANALYDFYSEIVDPSFWFINK